jgi:hypothetical protein
MQPLSSNDFAIPNIGAFPQSVTNAQAANMGLIIQAPKRGTGSKYLQNQFPPVSY